MKGNYLWPGMRTHLSIALFLTELVKQHNGVGKFASRPWHTVLGTEPGPVLSALMIPRINLSLTGTESSWAQGMY